MNRPRLVAGELRNPLHSGATWRKITFWRSTRYLVGSVSLLCFRSELPTFGFEVVLEMFLAVFGFAQSLRRSCASKMISWPFLARAAKFSADLPHTVTSTKVVTCWRRPPPSLKKSLLAIEAEATGVPELVSLKIGLATRLPLIMTRLIFTSL